MNRKPNLIIAGAPKSGTSSLFSYLARHKEICASNTKELHYFNPITIGEGLSPIDEYTQHFDHCSNQAYCLEASPGYMYGGEKIANAICNTLGKNTKIIFILRDPVQRIYSYYKHLRKHLLIGDIAFNDFIDVALKKHVNLSFIEKEKDPVGRAIRAGFYAEYLHQWYTVFDQGDIKVVFFDTLRQNPPDIINDILEWLCLKALEIEDTYSVVNKSVILRQNLLHKSILILNKASKKYFERHRSLKEKLRHLYFQINRDDSKKYDITLETKNFLNEIYNEQNAALYRLLKEKQLDNLPNWVCPANNTVGQKG